MSAETCQNCGESTGVIWRAIVYCSADGSADDASASAPPLTGGSRLGAVASVVTGATAPMPHPSDFLDSGERYRLLDALDEQAIATIGSDGRVLDTLPLAPSRLDQLCREQDISPDSASEVLASQCGIPAIALDYLELEQQLYPSLPTVQDAWAENGYTIVLLEDRHGLPTLQEFWRETPIAPFQVVHLFHQMAELWMDLQPYHYSASVLHDNNLRIDEDQLLYLTRLYPDPPDSEPDLVALGQFWETLLGDSSANAGLVVLAKLCQDLQSKAILLFEELRAHLEAIAIEFQSSDLPIDPFMTSTDTDDTSDLTLPLEKQPTTTAKNLPGSPYSADGSVAAGPTLIELGWVDDDDITGEADDIPTIVLPMTLMSLEDAGRSDVGRQREHNEDYFLIQSTVNKSETLTGRSLQVKGLYVLCDGMGGHASGEVASAMAAESLKSYFLKHWHDDLPSEETIRQGVLEANRALFEKNQENDSAGSGRMGTTLVLVLVQGTQAAIPHVGDSRLYRFSRRQGLEQVTIDHEVGQREIQRGVEPSIAYARPDAYQLTQALGPRDEPFVSPDIQFLSLTEDMLLLLCSDGLTDNDLLEKYCDAYVEPLLSSQANLEQGVAALIDLANHHNGHDNITTVVVRAKLRPNLAELRRP